MPIQYDVPSTVGAQSDWWLGAGDSKVAAVSTSDDDLTFLRAGSGGAFKYQLFGFPKLVGMATPLTSASLNVRARKAANGTGAQDFIMLWNSAPSGGNLWANLNLDFTYTNTGATIAAPTVAEANGEHGFFMSGVGGVEIWVTYLIRVVTYTPANVDSTGFAYLVGSWLLPIVGAALLRREMSRVALSVWEKARVWLKPDEYDAVFDVWKGLKHQKHFVLGA